MIEQLANAVTFLAFYTESKVGKTGLTVTIDVWEIQKDGTATEIVTAGSATEIGDGLYKYVLASGSVDAEGEYVSVFKTATTTVDQQHLPALWSVQRAGVENLDAATSTRSTVTTAQVNTEVDTALADYDAPTNAELVSEINSVQTDIAAIAAYVDTEIAAIKTKTDQLVFTGGRVDASVGAMQSGTMTAAALATDAVTEITAAIQALTLETGLTWQQGLQLITAAVAGKLSGAASVTNVIRNAVADDKNRITATVDEDGNRTAITYDLT